MFGYNLGVKVSTACLVVLLVITSAFSQTPRKLQKKDLPPSAFKLISIKVTGAKRYRPEEIIQASELQIGQNVNDDDFKKGVGALADSGAFTNIVYNFQYSNDGTQLELQVEESTKVVPAIFENLVWFTDKQLLDELHSRVPLFQGQVPVTGSLADQISQALQTMIAEKNVEGTVDYQRRADKDTIIATSFTVSGAQVVIRKVSFTGAASPEDALLESAAKPLQGTDYGRSMLHVQNAKNFLPIYLRHGYLKAKLNESQATVVGNAPEGTQVDVSIAVDPGLQYKLSALDFAGNKAFPSEQLSPLIHLHTGQPADAVQLDQDMEAMNHLYGTRGYMAVAIQATPNFDDAQSAVHYEVNIVEGDVYHMGDLEIKGLDDKTTARLANEWTLRPDDPYDASYPTQFMQQALREAALRDFVAQAHPSVNQKDKTVDVTVQFSPVRP